MRRAYRRMRTLVIAAILKRLGVDSSPESEEFRLCVQKVGYLVQKLCGIDLGLDFKWLNRGPYSRALASYYTSIHKCMSRTSVVDVESSECIAKISRLVNQALEVAKIDSIPLVLEIIASLIMLCTDIYPPPRDACAELLKRKSFLDKSTVDALCDLIKRIGLC